MRHNIKTISLMVLLFLFVLSCKKDGNDSDDVAYDDTPYDLNYGDFDPPTIPADNPLTVEGVKLGRMLFYEKRLSKDNSQSCAGCHRQEHAFTDTTRFSIGVEGLPGKRQAMSVFNTGWHTNEFFWDGRAHLLRDQSLLPIQDSLEMNETLANVIAKLSVDQSYRDQFVRAFGTDEITSERMSLAMEQLMSSIVSVNSKYDKYLLGETTLTACAERGKDVFFDEFNPGFPSL